MAGVTFYSEASGKSQGLGRSLHSWAEIVSTHLVRKPDLSWWKNAKGESWPKYFSNWFVVANLLIINCSSLKSKKKKSWYAATLSSMRDINLKVLELHQVGRDKSQTSVKSEFSGNGIKCVWLCCIKAQTMSSSRWCGTEVRKACRLKHHLWWFCESLMCLGCSLKESLWEQIMNYPCLCVVVWE